MTTRILSLLTLCLVSHVLSAAEIRIEGGMVAVHRFVAPHRAAVEQATGSTIVVKGSTGTKGLLALANGECDLAVTAISLDLMLAKLAENSQAVDAAEFRMHPIAEDRLVFIVHPELKIDRLSREQLVAVYAGTIRNWAEVGGPDLAIRLFTDPDDSGTSSLLRTALLGDKPIGSSRTELSNLRLVSNSVANTKGAIGAVSTSILDTAATRTLETERIARPLAFITKGEASTELLAIVEAYRKAVADE